MTSDEKLDLILDKISRLDEKVSRIEDRLSRLEDRVSNLEDRVNNLESSFGSYRKETNSRFDKLEFQVSSLQSGQIDIRNELEAVNIKVSETYQIALEAWGTSAENRKWLETTN